MQKIIIRGVFLGMFIVISGCTQQSPSTPQQPTTMHPSRDQNNDGINDCESDGSCDDSVDYSQPRQN